MQRTRGRRPFGRIAQFFYPSSEQPNEWTSALRPFDVANRIERIDAAILSLMKEVNVVPLKIAARDYVPAVGERVGLCGYAHGSILMTGGQKIERIGPLAQEGIIAALSPFDIRQPDRAVLDLVTGPAASGSPVFRTDTGEVIGFLLAGQVKRSAAFSIARLLSFDASTGYVTGRVGRLTATGLRDSSHEDLNQA